jgi:hypothetical protein
LDGAEEVHLAELTREFERRALDARRLGEDGVVHHQIAPAEGLDRALSSEDVLNLHGRLLSENDL